MGDLFPAMDLRFLRRLVISALGTTAVVAIVSAAFDRQWALHFGLVGFWMAVNAVFLGTLLWAGTSTPKRPFTLFVIVPVKVVWLAALMLYLMKTDPPATAVLAGLTIFFVAVVGSVLHWMQSQQGVKS